MDATWDAMFEGMEFSSDWASHNFKAWLKTLAWWRDKPVRFLEIGSWEGRSAVFFLEMFPKSVITCIDPFKWDGQEARFSTNTQKYAGRVTKIAGFSTYELPKLLKDEKQYDVIYIDGSHMRDDVMIDSLFCWKLLRRRGVLIWDDYAWKPENKPSERVQPAVDHFMEMHDGEFTLLRKGWQVTIRKEVS